MDPANNVAPETAPEVPATEGAATSDAPAPGAEQEPEETVDLTSETPTTGEGDAEVTPEETPEEGKEEKEGKDDAEPSKYFYNGEEVTVEVPEDMHAELTSKGIDVDKAVAELYAEGGEFQLSDETKEAAYKAYGKVAVDAFLGSLKAQNDAAGYMTKAQSEQDQREKAAAVEWSNELVGGAEEWDAMSEWAAGSEDISDEDIAAINAAIESGNKYVQELAIKDLHSRYKAAAGDTPSLVEGGGASRSGAGDAISAAEYQSEISRIERMPMRERAVEFQKLDARRAAGIKKGL